MEEFRMPVLKVGDQKLLIHKLIDTGEGIEIWTAIPSKEGQRHFTNGRNCKIIIDES